MNTLFHESVNRWFSQSFDAPSEIQHQAWPRIKNGEHTLIAAPTGSGKTLAAFLACIDDLVRKDLDGSLTEGTKVVYISPLKALSNDIEKNLQVPLNGIAKELREHHGHELSLRVGLRTGDTPSSERTAMVKRPPHILVTTPESLYLLLTSNGGRSMLRGVETLIIDEIHALINSKRGSHLSLSVERLNKLTFNKLNRIGLSATQNPIELVADFLTCGDHCAVVDTGHRRQLDLAMEVPDSPLTAVMPNEVWGEIYVQLEEMIRAHQTTLIFVNTRKMAERVAHQLSERLGDQVTSHHGSMSREHRQQAEEALKSGHLKALVATASLELGIDIGYVDLVCQLGSPRSIATFLQRVGRSGHSLKGTPKGRLFPLSRDELVECTAIMDAVRRGELDKIIMPEKPIDILTQQIVAETAGEEYTVEELYHLFSRAYPYRDLTREEFDESVKMLSEGFVTRNGRRRAYIHHDRVNGVIRGRKNARLSAITSGGSIPDQFDYDVVLEPQGTFVGTLNEDFAIESMPGDIFQLGNNSWQILRVESGKVRVADAHGKPPTIPFWFGEAPSRTFELSHAVSRLRAEISDLLGDLSGLKRLDEMDEDEHPDESWKEPARDFLEGTIGLKREVSDQIIMYLASAKAALGVMPDQETLVLERFFDESGDMHMVIHSPFGSRLNRAWGLSLRKRFCKKFNFELQAAATEDAIIISLGATHSFPLEEVFRYLNPKTVRGILIQAMLDAPMFETRWRWNATRALAVLRNRAGKRVPPQIQRNNAEDLIALVFPDQLACFENIDGEREVPDHPLVNQTIHDCLTDAMDIDHLEELLGEILAGNKTLIAKDLKAPSPLSAEILNARPYAFLDDAPLEERRTNAVQNRRWLDPAEAKDLGRLDPEAIRLVKEEAWPDVSDAHELHDALVLLGCMTEDEGMEYTWNRHFELLRDTNRAVTLQVPEGPKLWIASERLSQFLMLFPDLYFEGIEQVPDFIYSERPERSIALKEVVRGRLEGCGPVTVRDLMESTGLSREDVDMALLDLEGEGFVFRGQFHPDFEEEEWCERRLLARIHRYTLQKLRREIEPVNGADFMRYLFRWQYLDAESQLEGPDALMKVMEQLEGYSCAAASWESDILPVRIKNYDFVWLDVLSLSGRILWGKFNSGQGTASGGSTPVKSSRISFILRQNQEFWMRVTSKPDFRVELHPKTQRVFDLLMRDGAMFYDDLKLKAGNFDSELEDIMAELIYKGLITADSFTGLRALLVPQKYRRPGRRRSMQPFTMSAAGRWSILRNPEEPHSDPEKDDLLVFARLLLRRYGVVFRKMVERERSAPPWRELVRALRLLEARGEIRGGRFVEGVWGEQYALPEAIVMLRKTRKTPPTQQLISIAATDPLNLTGVLTPGHRVSNQLGNRILYKDGIPVAFKEGEHLEISENSDLWKFRDALIRSNASPRLRAYIGKGIG